MLNAVVRRDTPNALDMIESSIRFEQIRRIWTFSLDEDSRDVLKHLIHESHRVATAFERLFMAPRRVFVKKGYSYIDDRLELRVGTMIDAAEKLQSSGLLQASVAALNALLVSWESEVANIEIGVDLLRKIENSTFEALRRDAALHSRIIRALAKEASTGCSAEELKDLLIVVKLEGLDEDLSTDLYTAVEFFQDNSLSDEIHECRSVSEFEALDETLRTIADITQFDFNSSIESVREKMSEFENEQASYTDNMYEDWKDFRHERSNDDNEIHDIFDSLREIK